MKRNAHGALISVKDGAEIAGPCVCAKCGRTWTPSLEPGDACCRCDEQGDSHGETPLMCERCQDAEWRAKGATIVDVSDKPPEFQNRIRLAIEAANGNVIAQYRLGLQLATGSDGIEKDEAKAAHWIRLAAEGGLPNAQLMLGGMYLAGLGGLVRNPEQAASWATKSAEQGHSKAFFFLGRCYEDGAGVTQDYGKAAELFAKAYKAGITEAELRFISCMAKKQADELMEDPIAKEQGWTREYIIQHADEISMNTIRQEEQEAGGNTNNTTWPGGNMKTACQEGKKAAQPRKLKKWWQF